MGVDRRIWWLAAALLASVVLNVFLVGLTAGRFVGGGEVAVLPPSAPNAQAVRTVLDRFRLLPLADRLRFRAVMAEHRDQLREARIAVAQARRHAIAVLAAPDYDPKAMADAFAAIRQATAAAQTAQHAAMVQALGTFSPQARALLRPPVPEPRE